MKLEEALKEVMKNSPGNAAIRKCDLEKAMELMSVPAAAPKAPAAPEGDQAPAQP